MATPKAVVVGASDPPPHPLTVGSFYSARVLSANRNVSLPLRRLQGTHVSGGAVVWIVGDLDYMQAQGFHPLGMEPIGVGVTSDPHHIITPSVEGPKAAISHALRAAGLRPEDIATWDLHATTTPGDCSEVTTLRSILSRSVLVTVRKGTFGHGMSAGGGWELTAQYLAMPMVICTRRRWFAKISTPPLRKRTRTSSSTNSGARPPFEVG
jgi:3-oxoacyl-[acyl-carrier-protein] synthase II